jgi:hypothetical protein
MTLDSHLFESACDRGEFEQACRLYRADFLAGFALPDCAEFDDWAFFRREALRGRLMHALERLVQDKTAAGEYFAATAHAGRLVELDPLSEVYGRHLIRSLLLAGDRSSAEQAAAKGLAKANKRLFKESVSLSWKLYMKYRVRYLRTFIQRFAREAVVSFLIFVLLVEFLLHQFHIELFVSGVAVLALAYIAEKIVSARLRTRRRQSHSRALFNGTRDLYSDYLVFLRARAIAQVATLGRDRVVAGSLSSGNGNPDETIPMQKS